MMTRISLILAAAAAGLAGFSSAAIATPAPKSVIAEATGDLNGDGTMDRVQLLRAVGGAIDLAVYLSTAGRLPDKPTLYKAEIGSSETEEDRAPGLRISPQGTLLLEFGNDQSRYRWREHFTIAVREGTLTVVSYAYEAPDPLNPGAGESCAIDLLNGTGKRSQKPVTVPAGGVPVAQWTDDTVPAPCKFDR